MIVFNRVCASYQRADGSSQQVLHNIDLRIEQGEFVALMGRNGSGKTTLARLCNGLVLPAAGEVCINEYRLAADAYHSIQAVRRLVGMVFQNPENQIVSTTVEREIAFGLENLGLPHAEMHHRVDWALQLFDLEKYRTKPPSHLSGGEKQRLALAAVLAMQPAHLILDEPTAMLDEQHKRQLLNSISRLTRKGGREPKQTILLITQDPVEALFADRLIVLHAGKVVQDGTPRDIFLQEEKMAEIGLAVPIEFSVFHLLKKYRRKNIAIESLQLAPIL